MCRVALVASALAVGLVAIQPTAAQPPPAPIIDMHVHANRADSQGPPPLGVCPGEYPAAEAGRAWADTFLLWLQKPPCASPIWSPETDQELMDQTLAILRRRNVIGVASGPFAQAWHKAAPERIIAGFGFGFGPNAPSPDQVRTALKGGIYRVFGEVAIQYQGVEPNDPKFEPYWAMAEELDLPVSIHVGTGPPGATYLDNPNYRGRLHSPLLMEEVLVRHPTLRVSLMHAGWPMLDDLLATLWTHPQLYVDLGALSFAIPRQGYYFYLQRIIDAGFGKRVMFGSDQMVWPGMIDVGIDAIEAAPFLSASQKRDILYNNAARFLRLSDQEITRHHGR